MQIISSFLFHRRGAFFLKLFFRDLAIWFFVVGSLSELYVLVFLGPLGVVKKKASGA